MSTHNPELHLFEEELNRVEEVKKEDLGPFLCPNAPDMQGDETEDPAILMSCMIIRRIHVAMAIQRHDNKIGKIQVYGSEFTLIQHVEAVQQERLKRRAETLNSGKVQLRKPAR